MTLIRTLLIVLLALAPLSPAMAQSNATTTEEALLAVEEAELRERMMTALMIAQSVRLRGRTILVAMSQISHIRRIIDQLDPLSKNRPSYEERLRRLEVRRAELEDEVGREWEAYLEIVSTLAGDLWPRISRAGDQIADGLEERRLPLLAKLYPVMKTHLEEFNKSETVTRGMTERWRSEVDDTYLLRLEKLQGGAPASEPDLDSGKKEEDI